MKKNAIICLITLFLLVSMIILSSCTSTVTLYFTSLENNQAYLVKETREIKEPEGNIYKATVEELIKGPASQDLYPTIPPDSVVNSVKLTDGLAVVDFNLRIITNYEDIPHSSTTETLAIYSIVNTLTEFEEIDMVKITIEGNDSGEVDGVYIEDFWGHIGIYENFYRNTEIIKDNG
jgi:germination protein M